MNLKITHLNKFTFEQFKEFLNSLDDEKKTWALDLQFFKDKKEFYENMSIWCVVCSYTDLENEIISLASLFRGTNSLYKKHFNIDFGTENVAEISFVVKKKYQGIGIGTQMLKSAEKLLESGWIILAKHFNDNIASHKAFLKAGYSELQMGDTNNNWKYKKI